MSRLVAIREEPAVFRRWGDVAEAQVVEAFVGTDSGFVVELDGEVVGAIEYGEETDPMYRHAGIDLFLTTPRHGRGLGTDAIRTLARHLIEDAATTG